MNNPLRLRVKDILYHCDGFDEIGANHQHRIIYDICTRWEYGAQVWANLDDFVDNYTEWLNKHIRVEGADSYVMWEQWSEMLKELYLP